MYVIIFRRKRSASPGDTWMLVNFLYCDKAQAVRDCGFYTDAIKDNIYEVKALKDVK